MMAKLEGVKTLDMVNGEITKVAYGGAQYERVEGEAQAGDIALAIKSAEDTTLGNFYPVTDTSHGDIMYMDDANDEQVNPPEYFRIFRKFPAATKSSVEERVAKAEGEIESLKSDVAALKGESEYKRIGKDEARVGDYVKFIETYDDDITTEKMYEIDNVDYYGDIYFTDDVGDENYASSDDTYEVYRKVSAASVEAKPKPERLKVGDYAKVVGQAIITETGDIVKIIQDTGGQVPFMVETMDGKDTEWRTEESLVRATDEEVAEAKRAAEFAKFKEGDKVRLLSGGGESPLFGYENGEVYEVKCVGFRLARGKRIQIAGGNTIHGYATPDQLEILSEAEVEKLEREAAERKKWAEIGREVGEYKKGDIARVVDNMCAGCVSNGDIIEVLRQDSDGSVLDTVHEYYLEVELVTPVEARFDR